MTKLSWISGPFPVEYNIQGLESLVLRPSECSESAIFVAKRNEENNQDSSDPIPRIRAS